MSSKITMVDEATEASYKTDNFSPSSTVSELSYTASRVMIPNFNKYKKVAGKPQVIGYYTDWSQYDGRVGPDGKPTGDQNPANRGRGVDITKIDPGAFDKLIIGFAGILGDLGEKSAAITAAAPQFARTKNGQVTFLDPWGDCQSYQNCGFSGWEDKPMPASFNQTATMGILGGLRDMQQKAKQQGHALALSFSIGGWTMSNAFSVMVKSPGLRAAFCASVVDILGRFPMFTELDIDWEYPGAAGNNNPFDEKNDGPNYAILMRELVNQLNKDGLGYIKISIAASADPDTLAKANIPALLDAGLYGINLMTYDFFGTPWSPVLANHTNLYGPKGTWSVDNAVQYLLDVGVPANQINIGYAGYSRNAKGAVLTSESPLAGTYDNSGTSNTTGSFESGSTEAPDIFYNYLDLENQKGKNGFDVYTDEIANADYLYNAQSKLFMSIDTPRTVKAKGEYALEKGLGGLMTWTADQDTGGLYVNAAREGLGYEISTQKIDMQPFYFFGKNVTPSGDKPPVAIITGLSAEANPGERVPISGSSSSDQNDPLQPLSYQWTIPEGLTVVGGVTTVRDILIAVPVSDAKKSYDIRLTVRNNSKSATTTATLSVKGGTNKAPVAVITGPIPETVIAGQSATLSGERSYDDDGEIIQYFWQIPSEVTIGAGGINQSILTFTAPDKLIGQILKFTLTVTDNGGTTGSTMTTVTVAPTSSYPAWDAKTAYNAGDKVSYQEKNWIAQWWNQGVAPGTEEKPGEGAYPWTELPTANMENILNYPTCRSIVCSRVRKPY